MIQTRNTRPAPKPIYASDGSLGRDWSTMYRFFITNAKSTEMRGTLLCWSEIKEIEQPVLLAD